MVGVKRWQSLSGAEIFWLNITLLKLPSKHCLLPSLSESGAVQFYSFEHSAVQTFAQSARLYRGTFSVQILELSCTLVWNTCTAQQHSITRVLVPLLPNPRVSPWDLCFCFCLHVHCAYLSAHTSVQHRTPHWSPQCTTVPRNPTQCNKLHTTQCNPGHHSETLCTYLVQAQEADVSALGDLRCLPSSCFALTGCTSVPAYGTVSGVCTFQ